MDLDMDLDLKLNGFGFGHGFEIKQERMVHNPRPVREIFFRALFQPPSPDPPLYIVCWYYLYLLPCKILDS